MLGLTGHIVVAAGADPHWVRTQLPPWHLSEAFLPPFLNALHAVTGRSANAIDMVVLASPCAGAADVRLTAVHDLDHPGYGVPTGTATTSGCGPPMAA